MLLGSSPVCTPHNDSELFLIYFMKLLESFAYFSMSFCLVVYLSKDFGFSDSVAGWSYGLLNALTSVYSIPAGFLLIVLPLPPPH
jgi:dipeptide/tripeptide permease